MPAEASVKAGAAKVAGVLPTAAEADAIMVDDAAVAVAAIAIAAAGAGADTKDLLIQQ